MPKTTVNKYDYAATKKNKIRLPINGKPTSPAGDAYFSEEFYKAQLC